MSNEDAVLVRRLQAGDIEALGGLYDRHRLTVFRTALAITRDQDAAEDILQEAFLRLHAYIDRVDTRLPLAPWLYRITVNLAYTWVTRRNRWLRPLEGFIEQLIGPAMQQFGKKIGTGWCHHNGIGLSAQVDVGHVVGLAGIPL